MFFHGMVMSPLSPLLVDTNDYWAENHHQRLASIVQWQLFLISLVSTSSFIFFSIIVAVQMKLADQIIVNGVGLTLPAVR